MISSKPFRTGFWFGLGFVCAYYLIKLFGIVIMMLLLGGPMITGGINYMKCIL